MGITGFTLPTMYRWVRSEAGRRATLHPFQKGHYLGSGQANMVMKEAGLGRKKPVQSDQKISGEEEERSSYQPRHEMDGPV